MKLPPASRNVLKIVLAVSSADPQPQSVPKVMVPKQRRLTFNPLFPNVTYSDRDTRSSSQQNALDARAASPDSERLTMLKPSEMSTRAPKFSLSIVDFARPARQRYERR